MQQKKTKIVETAINEKPQSKTTKIEAISASGNLKVAVKGQSSAASVNVQSIAVERSQALKAKSATPLTAVPTSSGEPEPKGTTETAALPFPKKAKIQQSPKASQTAETPTPASKTPEQKNNRPLLLLAAVGTLVVGLGVVALQMGGSSDAEGQVTAAQPTVSSPIDISTATANPAGPVSIPNVTTEAAATGVEDLSHSEQMIAKMTAGTIAALRGQGNSAAAVPTTEQSAAEAAAASALYSMVVTAVSQGQSEAYIDQLVNDAYAKGEIAVPSGLVGASGRVDTKAILSLFIAQ